MKSRYAYADLTAATAQTVAADAGVNIGEFFESPGDYLGEGSPFWGDMQHYGTAEVVEFFVETTGVDGFVKESFDHLDGQTVLDGMYQISATLAAHSRGDLSSWIPYMWNTLYTMCDSANASLTGVGISVWCGYLRGLPEDTLRQPPTSSVPRPVHGGLGSDTGSRTQGVSGGGAVFQDFEIPQSAQTGFLTVSVTGSDLSNVELSLTTWEGTPSSLCNWGWADIDDHNESESSGAITLRLELYGGCSIGSIQVTNNNTADPTSLGVSIAWAAAPSHAVITNGTVTLGVSSYGAVVQEEYGQYYEGDPGPGLVYNATGVDELASSYRDCWGITGEEGSPYDGGYRCTFDGDPTRDVTRVSFTHTSSEATSVVLVGDARVTHYFHPVSDHVYAMDVTIRSADGSGLPADAGTIVYRRIMDTSSGPSNSTDPGCVNYVTLQHNTSQYDIAGYTNYTPWWGLGESLTPIDPTGQGKRCDQQGFAIDVVAPGSTTFRLYYGAGYQSTLAGEMAADTGGTYGIVTRPLNNSSPGTSFALGH